MIELKEVKLKYSDTLVVTFSESYDTTVSLSPFSELTVRLFSVVFCADVTMIPSPMTLQNEVLTLIRVLVNIACPRVETHRPNMSHPVLPSKEKIIRYDRRWLPKIG